MRSVLANHTNCEIKVLTPVGRKPSYELLQAAGKIPGPTKLNAGRSILHVLSDADPGDDFGPHEPDLEDVYFSTLLSANGKVAEAA